MERKFFHIVTVDVTDPFYQTNVEVKESDDSSMLVEDVASGRRRRFLKEGDPTLESMLEIEDPTQSGSTEELFSFLQREQDDSGNHRVQEQLRLEEQFGSYSRTTREQNIYLLQSLIARPKEIVIAASPSPNVDLERVADVSAPAPALTLAPNAYARSQLVVPIVKGSVQPGVPSVQDPFSKEQQDSTNSSAIDLLTASYESHGIDQRLVLQTDPAARVSMSDFTEPMRPTQFYLESTKHPIRMPPVPCLLYDIRSSGVMNYSKLKMTTCIRQDSTTRSRLYDDINLPIFSSPLHIPITNSHLQDVSIQRFYHLTPKPSSIPLMIAPYSHTVIPNPPIEKIGQDTDLMSEEYERHYVSLSRTMDPHPLNSMDAHMYDHLYRGIDVDNFNPSVDQIQAFQPITWESAFRQYVTLPYVPEPVLLTPLEKKVLQWATHTFPMQKSMIESYSLTRTPQTWFEYLSELYVLESTSVSQRKEEHVQNIRSLMNYPKSASVVTMKADLEDKQRMIRSERKRAETNLSLCYGLSIRKLYISLEALKEDIRKSHTVYWDQNRDPLMADIQLLRKVGGLEEEDEDKVFETLFDHLPFLSSYELKRRAHEVVQWLQTGGEDSSMRSQLRPGDLVMVRLLNASYIYEKTVDGWNSRTTNLDEQEFCETEAKGYLSLQEEQLTGKKALEDGCTFIDATCVPTRVQKWISLLESIADVKEKLEQADTLEVDTEHRKQKLTMLLQRFLSYARVLSKTQQSGLGDDSWSRLTQQILDTRKQLFAVVDEYERARAIPDFTKSWLQTETVLDRSTRFDEELRSYVEPTTRSIIACEHTTLCILAAKSGDSVLMSRYMRQLVTEYGNYDEVGQKAICKLCGEEIGDSVVSTQEGFGSDESPIQLRTTTEVAVNTDYTTLPIDAQRLYSQMVALRDGSGISLDESELARAAAIWNAKYIAPTKSDVIHNLLFNIHSISRDIKRILIQELVKLRIGAFIQREENRALFRRAGSNVKNRKRVEIQLKKRLAKEISQFLESASTELYRKPSLTVEEETKVRDYLESIQNISSELKDRLFGETSEYRNVSHAIHALIFAIQTAQQLAAVGLASVPGLARITRDTLYEEPPTQLRSYLVYIYAKKNRLREYQKATLTEIVSDGVPEDEAINQTIQRSMVGLKAKLTQKEEEEARLVAMDRTFTPDRHPFADSFRRSFPEDHQIQTILDSYEEISGSDGIEIDPQSIAPNTWMNYDPRGKGDVDISTEDRLHRDTLAIDVRLTRFPLSMSRLESMRESKDIESVESDILAFRSQYDIETGQSLRKLLLRSGGTIVDMDAFRATMEDTIPSVLLDKHRDWVERWIQGYVAYAGSVGSILEYDVSSHSFIGTKVDSMRKTLQEWKNTEDEIAYMRHIMQFRNQIRMRVGKQHAIPTTPSEPPKYDMIPRLVTSDLPDWYTAQQKFVGEQLEEDIDRLRNYLTQMNVKGDQVNELSVPYEKDKKRLLYDIDFKQYLTSIYFEMYRKRKQPAEDRRIVLQNAISNGSELIEIQQRELFTDGEWNRMITTLLGTYGTITEGVIEAHKAAVLARQNKERKARADAFTEEESGLNRLYRDFNLGRQFVSIDEMGMESEVAMVDQQFADAELIDEEAAADLMMGMGEDDGSYEFGEYETL